MILEISDESIPFVTISYILYNGQDQIVQAFNILALIGVLKDLIFMVTDSLKVDSSGVFGVLVCVNNIKTRGEILMICYLIIGMSQ